LKLILIRHGEPDYSYVTERQFKGHGKDLAVLSSRGKEQAEIVSGDRRLLGADIIVSSPYTRALQTAAIISRNTGIRLEVETDLHEWIVDLNYDFNSEEYVRAVAEEATRMKGVHSGKCKYNWESFEHVAQRAYRALYPYLKYDKVIVVTHGIVMQQFKFQKEIPYCGIIELDFDETYSWPGYLARIY